MKIVIQCAGRKRFDAGRLRDDAGAEVSFVARPDLCDSTTTAFRPDDHASLKAGTWREVLVKYNERYRLEGENPDNLLSAGNLYWHRVYRGLVTTFGTTNLFILSAGWGLVRADFLLPDYDITFSNQPKVSRWARRSNREDGTWQDFRQLFGTDFSHNEPVHFFGGNDYLPLFYRLLDDISTPKVIHHKVGLPHRPGYEYRLYTTEVKTNWHYLAAEEFIHTHQREAE